MKKMLGVLLVLVILIPGGYYGMGWLTERTIRHNLDAVNRSNGLAVTLKSYHRGWFKSTAELDWKLHVPERMVKNEQGASEIVAAQDFNTSMKLDIYHGPVMLIHHKPLFGLGFAETNLQVPEQYDAAFNELFTTESTKPILQLSIFVNYLNNSHVELALPSFKLFAKKGGEFDWLGMQSFVHVSSNAAKVQGEVTLDGIDISKDDAKVTIGQIKSTYQLHKTADGLYLGNANMTFPSLILTKGGQKIFEMSGFDINSNSDVSSGLFSSHFKSTLEKVLANGKSYGPGILDVSVRNLDAEVLGKINAEVNQIHQGTEMEKQKALFAILAQVPKLFAKGPEFELTELSFVMPEGTLQGSVLVSLPENTSANPFELLQKIQGKGKFRIPVDVLKVVLNEINQQKLLANSPAPSSQTTPGNPSSASSHPSAVVSASAEMTDKQIQNMMQSGLITQSGNSYVIEVNLEGGKLLVNGNPFNPAMLNFQ